MKAWTKPRKRQWIGIAFGTYFAGVTAVIGFSGLFMPFLEKGPMNTGHESLHCADCHRKAPGTVRQQLQANVKYALALRQTNAVLGRHPVENKDCISCHERPNDPHPVYRFIEPRFAEVRKKIQPHSCVSCHQEHQGRRVTTEPDYCRHCHDSLELKKDPLDISHKQLIAEKNWNSCLGCHDFHGNYIYDVPTKTTQAIPLADILGYFQGQFSPYSKEKKHAAHKQKK